MVQINEMATAMMWNAYLHMRGHNVFDLVAYIGDLLCRGTFVSFNNDILTCELPPQTYWQIKPTVRLDIYKNLEIDVRSETHSFRIPSDAKPVKLKDGLKAYSKQVK